MNESCMFPSTLLNQHGALVSPNTLSLLCPLPLPSLHALSVVSQGRPINSAASTNPRSSVSWYHCSLQQAPLACPPFATEVYHYYPSVGGHGPEEGVKALNAGLYLMLAFIPHWSLLASSNACVSQSTHATGHSQTCPGCRLALSRVPSLCLSGSSQ